MGVVSRRFGPPGEPAISSLLPAQHEGDPLSLYGVERPAPGGRPWVAANFVSGLDGSVAVDGRVGPLTSPTDQRVFHHLRSLADVILVGAGTVRAERYGPARMSEEQRQARVGRGQTPVPPIAVVSRSLSFDWDSRFFAVPEARPLVIAPRDSEPRARARAEQHAELVVAGEDRVDLGLTLSILGERGCRLVLCEGGPELVAELAAGALLDELCLTLAPHTGGDPLRLFGSTSRSPFVSYHLAHVLAHDEELYLRYLLRGEPVGG